MHGDVCGCEHLCRQTWVHLGCGRWQTMGVTVYMHMVQGTDRKLSVWLSGADQVSFVVPWQPMLAPWP